jgi:DNA-binding MarR family transcriptional regulator
VTEHQLGRRCPRLADDDHGSWYLQMELPAAVDGSRRRIQITNRFRRDLAGIGLSLEQFDVLIHLAGTPSGTLPLHELTASMVIGEALSRSGITRLLDRMERDGLITRTTSATDRRRFDVSLTPHGRQRFGQIWPAHADAIERYFAQHLTPGDVTELARILDALIQANQNHSQPG